MVVVPVSVVVCSSFVHFQDRLTNDDICHVNEPDILQLHQSRPAVASHHHVLRLNRLKTLSIV